MGRNSRAGIAAALVSAGLLVVGTTLLGQLPIPVQGQRGGGQGQGQRGQRGAQAAAPAPITDAA